MAKKVNFIDVTLRDAHQCLWSTRMTTEMMMPSPFARYVVTQAVLNVVQGERYKTIPDEVRKYATGYYGRLAAPLAPEFLEHAKLKPEEMVSERPGEHIPPWIPRLRKELGPDADDEELPQRAPRRWKR